MESGFSMNLFVWEGDYGLISLNYNCIQTILYAKIANVPLDISYRTNPYFSFAFDYPVLKHKKVVLTKVEDIFDYFRRENYGADYMLTKKECSLSHAYTHMVTRNLKPVLDFVYWANNRNYEELTRIWYSRAMYMPFNYVYINGPRKRALNLLEVQFPSDYNLELIEKEYCKQITTTLTNISNHLGKHNYFFGDFPSSIDALLYSYLAPLIKIPFPCQEIPIIVKSFQNIVQYVNRIDQKYFPDLNTEVRYLKKEEESKKCSEEDFHTSVKTKILTFTFVCVAMFGYAASNNIIDMYKIRQFFTG